LTISVLATSLAVPVFAKTLEIFWRIDYKVAIVGRGTFEEKSHKLDVGPKVVDGVIHFPLRFLGEFTGHNLVWVDTQKQALMRGQNHNIKLTLGKTEYLSSGSKWILKKPPIISKNRMLVGSDFFEKELGLAVISSDSKTATMTIDSEAIKPKAVDFTLPTHDGKTVNFNDVLYSEDTKIVLVNFWSTRCQPCRLEIPELIRLYNKYGDKGLKIIGVSTDSDVGDTMDIERAEYIEELGMNYIVALDPLAEVYYQWGGLGVPNVSIVDKTGMIIYQHEGFDSSDKLENFIKKQLGIN
jgi:peroxiredoxin